MPSMAITTTMNHQPASPSNTITTPTNHFLVTPKTAEILTTNSLHFITLSLLYIPTIFFVSIAIDRFDISFDISQNLLNFKTLTTLFAVILSTVAGTALITYSTYQAMKREPLTFISAFKSLFYSFIPLLFTFIAGFIKLVFISIATSKAITSMNVGFDYLDKSTRIVTFLLYVAIWGSAAPISVLELKSGFVPLRLSANQSYQFRFSSIILVYVTGILLKPLLSYYYVVVHGHKLVMSWPVIVKFGMAYLASLLLILQYAVVNTVLYVHCKVARGEDTTDKIDFYLGFREMLCYMLIFYVVLLIVVLFFIPDSGGCLVMC